MVIGCAMGNLENLAGGLLAASAALFAGWLAWSAVQVQISAEEKRAAADRVEIEDVLQGDLEYLAPGLAAIWKILEGIDQAFPPPTDVLMVKLEGIVFGIGQITKDIATMRKMVTALGWERRAGSARSNSSGSCETSIISPSMRPSTSSETPATMLRLRRGDQQDERGGGDNHSGHDRSSYRAPITLG